MNWQMSPAEEIAHVLVHLEQDILGSPQFAPHRIALIEALKDILPTLALVEAKNVVDEVLDREEADHGAASQGPKN